MYASSDPIPAQDVFKMESEGVDKFGPEYAKLDFSSNFDAGIKGILLGSKIQLPPEVTSSLISNYHQFSRAPEILLPNYSPTLGAENCKILGDDTSNFPRSILIQCGLPLFGENDSKILLMLVPENSSYKEWRLVHLTAEAKNVDPMIVLSAIQAKWGRQKKENASNNNSDVCDSKLLNKTERRECISGRGGNVFLKQATSISREEKTYIFEKEYFVLTLENAQGKTGVNSWRSSLITISTSNPAFKSISERRIAYANDLASKYWLKKRQKNANDF